MTDKKPDNVADNPGLLPYGSNVGSPSIKPQLPSKVCVISNIIFSLSGNL